MGEFVDGDDPGGSASPTRFDSLEAELASFRPRAASEELSARIAGRIGRDARRSSLGMWVAIGSAGLAAAACVALAVSMSRHPLGPSAAPGGGPVVVAPTSPNVARPPAGLAYERSAAHAPESVDAVLDRHAARLPRANQAAAGGAVEAFTRNPNDVTKLTGEPP
jgi:hypothetical protein